MPSPTASRTRSTCAVRRSISVRGSADPRSRPIVLARLRGRHLRSTPALDRARRQDGATLGFVVGLGESEDRDAGEGDTHISENEHSVGSLGGNPDDDDVELALIADLQRVGDRPRDDGFDARRERGNETADAKRVLVDNEDQVLAVSIRAATGHHASPSGCSPYGALVVCMNKRERCAPAHASCAAR